MLELVIYMGLVWAAKIESNGVGQILCVRQKPGRNFTRIARFHKLKFAGRFSKNLLFFADCSLRRRESRRLSGIAGGLLIEGGSPVLSSLSVRDHDWLTACD